MNAYTTFTSSYICDITGNLITLTIDASESRKWEKGNNRRLYHDVYQSDRRTRVDYLYEVIDGTVTKGDKTITTRGGRTFGYRLTDAKYTQNVNLIYGLQILCEDYSLGYP